jgi:hypothetical protein
MKRAVSISIGSSKRDKAVEIQLLGETVRIERIGTDGDMEKAARLYAELDGRVDAFGVGGADLGILVDTRWYPLYSVQKMVRHVKQTPVVDGSGLKITLERRAAPCLESSAGDYLRRVGRRAFLVTGSDRWGLTRSFVEASYQCLFGDLMFALGLPFPLYSPAAVKRLASILMPVAGRIPFQWVYPTGKEQEKRTPKWLKQFAWATVIAGDCHYIRRYMPERMDGKVIVTNTTTQEDVDIFRCSGVKYLVTKTPVLEGRSFGTNVMEAAIAAAVGRKEPIDYGRPGKYLEDLDRLLDRLQFQPQIQELT